MYGLKEEHYVNSECNLFIWCDATLHCVLVQQNLLLTRLPYSACLFPLLFVVKHMLRYIGNEKQHDMMAAAAQATAALYTTDIYVTFMEGVMICKHVVVDGLVEHYGIHEIIEYDG